MKTPAMALYHKAQAEALYELLFSAMVLRDHGMTVRNLMMAVRDHPCWRGYEHRDDETKFQAVITTRLKLLETEGRIENGYAPRPKGGYLRVVSASRRHWYDSINQKHGTDRLNCTRESGKPGTSVALSN
jgi:hypothetical protein